MQRVNAATSDGSMVGNIAMRSWLRPSFRYESVSTIPLARNVLASSTASMDGSKSMVPTTCERSSGFSTNGEANDDASAHPYSVSADASERDAAHSSPPFEFIHSSESASRNNVISAGVL